jgi:hypothetical protein
MPTVVTKGAAVLHAARMQSRRRSTATLISGAFDASAPGYFARRARDRADG